MLLLVVLPLFYDCRFLFKLIFNSSCNKNPSSLPKDILWIKNYNLLHTNSLKSVFSTLFFCLANISKWKKFANLARHLFRFVEIIHGTLECRLILNRREIKISRHQYLTNFNDSSMQHEVILGKLIWNCFFDLNITEN